MAYLFWGFLFIFKFPFAYLTFKLWGLTLGLPDFVGFVLVWRGLVELTPESQTFKKLIPASIVFIFASTAKYILTMFNLLSSDKMSTFVVEILYNTATLFFCYLVVRGIRDMEIKRNAEFYSAKLFRAWVAVFVFTICSMLPVNGLKLVGALGIVVVSAMFLVRMWDSMKNYKACIEKNGPATK
ncbi:MAG: hypothetical protein IKR39_06785 [Lachnospiraceae bacterium]|nr:hypothetical protein [Lachnospiraceae bacterium]